jgi:tripartite-type tricarboxylate transporter receptor subunit TctC
MTFSSSGAVLPQVKSGKLKLLAVCTSKRLATLPQVPTVGETLPGYEIATWYGLAGPAKLPKAIVERLSNEIQVILKEPDVVKRFQDLDAEVGSGGAEEFALFWRKEIGRYTKLVKDARIES